MVKVVDLGTPLRYAIEPCWLHIADLDCGRPTVDGWDHARILLKLLEDVQERTTRHGFPAPQMVFVAGNLTHSASAHEFVRASEWLKRLGEAIHVGPERTFTVPGDRDVNIGADRRDPKMAALVRSVREGLALLDDVVDQHPNWTRLESRMRGYMDFERLRRRGASRQKIPWWTHAETVGAGLRLRIAGVNTVLVTNGEDRGKLVVGEDQLSHLFATTVGPKDLVIALSHHPTSGGWLADEDGVAARLRMSAHVHLHGRMPEVGVDEAKAEHGVSLAAGALRRSSAPQAVPRGYRYNYCAVVRGPDARCVLRVWTRGWSSGGYFTNACTGGRSYVDHPLPHASALIPERRAPSGGAPVRP